MNDEYLGDQGIGAKLWVIPEGYIPRSDPDVGPEMMSHESLCVLNANEDDAHITLTVYYTDRSPVGPYTMIVPAQRTRHFRFNDMREPEPIPEETDFSSVIESSIPVVVQHTRLDTRRHEKALLSTIAYTQSELG